MATIRKLHPCDNQKEVISQSDRARYRNTFLYPPQDTMTHDSTRMLRTLVFVLIFLGQVIGGNAFVIAHQAQTSTSECLSRWPLSFTRSLQRRQEQRMLAATTESTNDKNSNGDGGEDVDLEWLKTELQAYIKKRQEVGADDLAQQEVGKVVGGTKGNPVLEFVSGA